MKVFLSHCSINKRNVKAIADYLPAHIKTWLDEKDLVWGEKLAETFEKAIKTAVDYVIVFLSDTTDNTWVLKEMQWAREKEKEIGRTFVLPVILPSGSRDPLDTFPDLRNIKYIMLHGYDENAFRMCADQISMNLFALLCADLDRQQRPQKVNLTESVTQAEQTLHAVCDKIYNIVFKYRISKPISIDELYMQILPQLDIAMPKEEFLRLLDKVAPQMSGIYYDGYMMYLIEEHSDWKSNIASKQKAAIGRVAASLIRNGQKVYIDAGSTTAEIIHILCKRIESHALNRVQLVLISTEHASEVIDTCARLGYDSDTAPIKLYIPGGMVRPNTKALIGIGGADTVADIVKSIGKFDVAFIGSNAATVKDGIGTHDTEEICFKRTAINNSVMTVFAMDDTKIGIAPEVKLADLSDNILVITNENADNAELRVLSEKFGDKVRMVKCDEK